MHRLLLRTFSLAIIAVALSSFSGTSMAADASPKTSAVPEASSANNPAWKEYKKLLENYYFLDKQKAGHISCRLSSAALQDYIDNMRQKAGNKLILDENLHDFSVTYDHKKGLSFDSPHLKISFSPNIKLNNPEGAERGRQMAEKGFDGSVHGVEVLITDTLTDMILPSPETSKNLSLTKNGDVIVVAFDDDNVHEKVKYSGSTQEKTMSSPTFNVTGTSDYQPLNGKLALAHLASETTIGSTKIKGTTSVSYQDLGSAFFPAQILSDVTASEDIQQPNTEHLEIDLKDCKTSDLSP